MGVYDELQKISTDSPTPVKATNLKKQDKPAKKPIDQLINQSINQSIDQSTNQSTNRFDDVNDIGPVIEKPRGFYITEKVDKWLGNAVRHLQDKGLHKVDRSVLINALLHDPELYTPAALDKLRERILAHLTNKSFKRV